MLTQAVADPRAWQDDTIDEAKAWYEHVFDPTEPADAWKFLPFLRNRGPGESLPSCRRQPPYCTSS